MHESEVQIVVPDAHFTLFNAEREGLPEVIVVNDALLSFLHLDVFPWHLKVVLEAQDLVDNGMPSPSESQLLFQIGDEIEAVVMGGRTEHDSANALFLVRSTWNGIRELWFQVHDPEIAHGALQSLLESRQWSRPWEYSMESDPQWQAAGYAFQLFPMAQGRDA